jgi:hypothetical protein
LYESARSDFVPTTMMTSSDDMFARSSVGSGKSVSASLNKGEGRTFEPVLDVLQARLVRHIVNKNRRQRSSIIQRRKRSKSLLPRRIPQLKSHLRVFDDELLRVKGAADGRGSRAVPFAVDGAVDEAGFADSLTSDCGEEGDQHIIKRRGEREQGVRMTTLASR